MITHSNSPPTPSLTLVLHHASQEDDDIDFFTPEPLNIYHPDKPTFTHNGGDSNNTRVVLFGSSICQSKPALRRSPRLLVESAGIATKKCGSTLLVKLPDKIVSEKKACHLAKLCLGDNDFNVRCLRSRNLSVTSSSRKRKERDSDDSRWNRVGLLGFKEVDGVSKVRRSSMGGNVGRIEGVRVLRSGKKGTVVKSRGKFGNVGKAVGKRRSGSSSRSFVRGNSGGRNGEEEVLLICGPGLSMKEDSSKSEGGRELRRSPRSFVKGNVGKNGVKGTLLIRGSRSSMVEDSRKSGGGRQLRCSPRSSMVENSRKSEGGRQLRCSPRSSMVEDSRKSGGGRQLRCSPRSSMVEDLRKSEGGRDLRCSPRSPMSGKIGDEKLMRCLPRSSIIGKNGVERQPRRSSRSSPLVVDNGEESMLRRLRELPFSFMENGFNEKESLEMKCDKRSRGESMEGNAEHIDEEKVLRRSPRALPSSLMLDDDVFDDEIKLLRKKKKKISKEKIEEDSNKVIVLTSTEKKEREKRRSKCFFVGEPVSEEEAQQRWQWRYELKNRRNKRQSLTGNGNDDDEPILNVKCHYVQAQINGRIFNLGDCALIRGDGKQKHIGRIKEFLRTMEEEDYFRVQWFYKAEDTVMKKEASFHDKKRIFYSTIENDNTLDCIISKLNVTQVAPELNFDSRALPPSDYYYDMEYCLDYSTFRNLPRDNCIKNYELASVSSLDPVLSVISSPVLESASICETYSLLDLYAGCGAMSTGLCFGARHSGVKLVTRWAIDTDSSACDSLRLNHSETQVRNEAAEDFLELLKHWEKLCKKFVTEDVERQFPEAEKLPDFSENSSDAHPDSEAASDELEVSGLVDICYESADSSGKGELKFKVRWKGYGPDDDTWEPIEGLSNCEELIQDFVINGFKKKFLPLPGDVDVICGGPPCQGISGYNRFRSVDDPLSDERNRQLIVYMDIVDYLKPKFVLMENVSDILRFDKGSLGRYALSRLVHMHYQARIGIMAAGCYGLPQFRLRVFYWGALPTEELPQFPLPTHDVVVRWWPPLEFERNLVGYEEGQPLKLEDAVLLGDAISDLPVVTNFGSLDEMAYSRPPETEFQKYIRSFNHEEPVLYDHRPHQLFEDDYVRVCKIPQKKGANFRDLPGIIVGDDNVVRRDPSFKKILLPSGKPMVPEYAITFEQGKSKRPFARLWWDETMPTIVTVPNCHCQAILHPEQDRVLTIRECARLQGFPDSYRICGTVKHRYRQVGNAVAIPVAKALGFALGMASQRGIGKEALLTLPPKFAYSN